MRRTAWAAAVLGILSLAACGAEGGELKEATERRRREQASADDDSAGKRGGGEDRLPAFASAADSAAAAAPAPPPAADTVPVLGRPTGQWTAGELEMERPEVRGIVRKVRVARNQGFDRMVIDFGPGAAIPGWTVEYVDRPVHKCGSGDVTEIAGQGWLAVRLVTAQAHDDDGRATVAVRAARPNAPMIREWQMTCDFEGEVEIVLGVATPNPYRVLELANPSRLVIDVQQ